MTKTYRRSGGIAAFAAVAAFGVAGCGGSSSPHVANLGNSGNVNSTGSTTTLPKGNPTQLLDEWATCMRSHGNPGQVDPTVDANGVIHITFADTGNGPVVFGKGSNNPCDAYLTAASTALRGGRPLQKPDPAKLEKFAQCMRANGVPDFPDPNSGGLSIQVHPGSDLNPQSPTFQNASKLCAKKTGVPGIGGTPPRGAIEATAGGGPGGPAGGPGAKGGSGNIGFSTGGSGG
ncbi:MAG TPA: hypothetical protein VFV02_11400 [Acidimicrobiales bacterium]|nr:hypothetical protein [Acidimicrobiales bacterium]